MKIECPCCKTLIEKELIIDIQKHLCDECYEKYQEAKELIEQKHRAQLKYLDKKFCLIGDRK